MAVKKSELYSTLWKCCDELRGGMDASPYKDYVLVILFVKSTSDKSRNDTGFVIDIPERCYFEDFVALNIGEEINKKMAAIVESNLQLSNVFVADFDDETKLGKGKDKVETLSGLIGIFQSSDIDFSKNRAADDDLICDAYEYLMKNSVMESGKSKGLFYTPAEVSRVMAKVIGLDKSQSTSTIIYDPTCGSGSLLLRAMSETQNGATLYGQEKDNATVCLAKMNMILHSEQFAEIKQGDTINAPQYKDDIGNLQTFDFVVANPPFSTKSWLKSAKEEDEYHRRDSAIGVPPEKNGDYVFLLHIVRSLKQAGCGACILPHGVLFRGNAEAQIRKYLVAEKRYIKGIIGLPASLFYGIGIPACIIIVEKSGAENRKGVFIIDAKNGFIKDGAKNRLREQGIRRIVDVLQAQRDVPHYAKFVTLEEIARNDYNLNTPRYIEIADTEILQDIDAHLQGGSPQHDIEQMQYYWSVCPSLRNVLFAPHKTRTEYFELSCPTDAIRDTGTSNKDFKHQTEFFNSSFDTWYNTHRQQLYGLTPGFGPKRLIEVLSHSILDFLKLDKSLVGAYDVYDCLMAYWGETMQDDYYMIAADGWRVQLYTPQPAAKKKEKKAATPDDAVCDMLPVAIVINEYFAKEQQAILAAEEVLNEKETKLEELCEEHTEGYPDENNFIDKKLSDGNIKKRIKTLDKKSDSEELAVLNRYLDLKGDISLLKKMIKELKYNLLTALIVKYANFAEDDIKELVIERKWFGILRKQLNNEMQRIRQKMATAVTQVVERYATTLSEIDAEVLEIEARVNNHLKVIMRYKI